jgi:hypothetical protein
MTTLNYQGQAHYALNQSEATTLAHLARGKIRNDVNTDPNTALWEQMLKMVGQQHQTENATDLDMG